MFFELSKILAFFTVPSNLMVLIAALGVVLIFTRFARAGRRLAVLGVGLLALAGFAPLGNALILPLEQRFPPWDASRGPPDGIVVVGGAIGPAISGLRGEPSLNEAAERITIVGELAQRYPKARIVFTGGDGTLSGTGGAETEHALRLFEGFGITRSRIELESASRNTAENATLTKKLVDPKPGGRWILVTSAHHMPRAIGCFRRTGFAVEAYPVDWRTGGSVDLLALSLSLSAGLARTDVAVREWIGLVIYWLTGRTSELFPGPN
jgi:uncharacterized SAM-binding protein YcdF (DUF218 family)